MEVVYKTKTADEESIVGHLRACNDNFSPPLAERVNIEEYSQKIFRNAVTFEAWDGYLLAGLVAAYFNDGPDRSVFITNVSVLQDFTGLGIASKLLGNCVEYAVNNNFSEIKLEVSKASSHAISLYRKFAFTNAGEIDGFLHMQMLLSK